VSVSQRQREERKAPYGKKGGVEERREEER
jgi:hypothetical protein